MIDLEIASYFERLLQGIRVTPETVVEEIIKQVVPTGTRYREHPHTLTHFRDELWLPDLADRRLPAAWAENRTTMLDNPRAKAPHLIESAANQCPLDERQKAEIRRTLEAADREVG